MKRYIKSARNTYQLPEGFQRRSQKWIRENFGLDFLDDDKLDCMRNGLEFVGYATDLDDAAYCVIAKDKDGRVGCYNVERGRAFEITSPDEMY